MANDNNHSHISGWGSDLDHANRPAYPRERMPPRLEGIHWTQPEQQRQHIPVFHSVERDGLTPVFGTSTPPSGLSGLIRKGAFRLSENDLRHWLLLFLADRVNVVEGLLGDARKSKRAPAVAALGFVGVLGFALTWFAKRRR